MGMNISNLWDKPNIYIKLTNVTSDERYYYLGFDMYNERGGSLIQRNNQMLGKDDVGVIDESNLIKSLYPYIKTFFTDKFTIDDVLE